MLPPTSPVPLARPPHTRDSTGLFAPASAMDVVRNLRQDLLAAGASVDDVSAKFASAASKYATHNREPVASQTTMQNLAQRLAQDTLAEGDLPLLVQLLYFAGYQRLLAKHRLRFPAYMIADDHFANAVGPSGPRVLPRPRVLERSWTLFGRQIGFPIGVPACALTGSSAWLQYLGCNGFNVLTYKTVRSRAQPPHQPPNWTFVPDVKEPFERSDQLNAVSSEPHDWVNPNAGDATTANSFGVPSPEPYEWMADVANALTAIADDQLLIVSVMGDDYYNETAQLAAISTDFAVTAKMAEDSGASVIELDLSCPNSLDITARGVKPPLCYNADVAIAIIQETRATLKSSTAIVAKLSYLDEERLSKLIHRISPLIDGIAGINTLQCAVRRSNGQPTFPGRELAGVSGIAIRDYALDFTDRLARLRAKTGGHFEILAMGGVTDPGSFQALFELGANVVQTASGAFANPFLAAECVESIGRQLPDGASHPT